MPLDDEYSKLQHLQFRGLVLPVTSRSVTFSHEGTEHTVTYGKGQIVDLTGAQNLRFRYTVPMREGINKGPYSPHLFTLILPALLKAMQDRSAGDLIDPVLGPFVVKPRSFIDESDILKRDGDDVSLEFTEHLTLDDIEGDEDFGSIEAIVSESEEVDKTIAKIAWAQATPEQLTAKEVTWEQSPPPPPTINPIDLVSGVLRQGEFAIKRSKSVFKDTANRIKNLENSIDALGGEAVGLRPFQMSLRRLRLRTLKAQNRQASRGKLLTVSQLKQEMTPLDAAAFVGLTTEQFSELNLSLTKKMFLPSGTYVTHYRAGE